MNRAICDDSDISDGGTLNALLDIGLDLPTALAEAKENQQDQEATNSKTMYDPVNHLLFEIDNGKHGANNEKLKNMSKTHFRTKSDNSKHGCHNAGFKEFAMFFTDGFSIMQDGEKILDPEIKKNLDKPVSERSPLEKMKISVCVISKTDEFDPVEECPLNQINMDYISPIFYGGKYKNEPVQATPLSKALWNEFSIDPTKPGTIIIVPVCKKIHNELMTCLSTKDVSKNLPLFLSKTYNKLLSGEIIDITFECIDFDIKIENDIQINISSVNIPGLDTNMLRAISFDPLHLTKIDSKYQMSVDIIIFEKDK